MVPSPEPMNGATREVPCKERQVRLSDAWTPTRNAVRRVIVGNNALPSGQRCKKVGCEQAASMRCQDCSPLSYHCPSCSKEIHTDRNVFHRVELWKVMIRSNEQVSKITATHKDQCFRVWKLLCVCITCQSRLVVHARTYLVAPFYLFPFSI